MTNTNEIWKAIPGYNGFYEISSHGRVRSWIKKGRAVGRREEPVLLTLHSKGGFTGATYPFVALYCDGKREQRYVHHLVAEAFIGPRPGGQQVAHNDGNPKNNFASNLRYATPEDNSADKKLHGTQPSGEAHPHAKLNREAVAEIRRLADKAKKSDLAERFGVTVSTISSVIANRTWKAA